MNPDALRQPCWTCLGAVDVAPLVSWLAQGVAWPPVKGGQPNRVHAPAEAVPVIRASLALFGDPSLVPVAPWNQWWGAPLVYDEYRACLSRIIPGRGHPYHQDSQPPAWVTRVHVPILTNPDAWFMWEPEDGVKVHFAAGQAYTFNTLVPHAFANDGPTDRVHLTFDVLRGEQ